MRIHYYYTIRPEHSSRLTKQPVLDHRTNTALIAALLALALLGLLVLSVMPAGELSTVPSLGGTQSSTNPGLTVSRCWTPAAAVVASELECDLPSADPGVSAAQR